VVVKPLALQEEALKNLESMSSSSHDGGVELDGDSSALRQKIRHGPQEENIPSDNAGFPSDMLRQAYLNRHAIGVQAEFSSMVSMGRTTVQQNDDADQVQEVTEENDCTPAPINFSLAASTTPRQPRIPSPSSSDNRHQYTSFGQSSFLHSSTHEPQQQQQVFGWGAGVGGGMAGAMLSSPQTSAAAGRGLSCFHPTVFGHHQHQRDHDQQNLLSRNQALEQEQQMLLLHQQARYEQQQGYSSSPSRFGVPPPLVFREAEGENRGHVSATVNASSPSKMFEAGINLRQQNVVPVSAEEEKILPMPYSWRGGDFPTALSNVAPSGSTLPGQSSVLGVDGDSIIGNNAVTQWSSSNRWPMYYPPSLQPRTLEEMKANPPTSPPARKRARHHSTHLNTSTDIVIPGSATISATNNILETSGDEERGGGTWNRHVVDELQSRIEPNSSAWNGKRTVGVVGETFETERKPGGESASNRLLVGAWSAASAELLGDLEVSVREKANRAKKRSRKDKPKRPLSAYNIFFREERERILAEIPGEMEIPSHGQPQRRERKKKPHGKIGFQDLAKSVGQRWQQLTPEEMEAYKEKANAELVRYKKEMELFVKNRAMETTSIKNADEEQEIFEG